MLPPLWQPNRRRLYSEGGGGGARALKRLKPLYSMCRSRGGLLRACYPSPRSLDAIGLGLKRREESPWLHSICFAHQCDGDCLPMCLGFGHSYRHHCGYGTSKLASVLLVKDAFAPGASEQGDRCGL